MGQPQIILKELAGDMDLDSPNENIGLRSHREMWNGRFNGPRGNKKLENILGTRLIPGQDTLNGSDEKTIGRWEDKVYHRVFFFNYSPSGAHGIYIYNILSGIFQTLIKNGVNTDGNILDFTADGAILNIDMFYGDPQEGNILLFLDSSGKPTKINVERYLASTYTDIPAAYLNVIKAPPIFPPLVTYENDTTVLNNNLLNSLFQFAYAYIYDDNEKSVLSSGSIVPLPVFTFSNTENIDKSKDARIAVYMNTGPTNVIKLKLFAKQTQNGSESDWLEIDTIDKDGLEDDAIYKYLFFNSGNYPAADAAYTALPFDFVPDIAASQAVLNGNTLAYGNIIEGQDWFPSEFSYQILNRPRIDTVNGFLFFASLAGSETSGQPNVTMVVTGAGDNDVNGNPVNVETTFATNGSLFNVNALSDTTDISFNISNFSVDIPTILDALSAAAVSAGWVAVPGLDTPNSRTIYYPTGDIVLKSSYFSLDNFTENPTKFAFIEQSNYALGIVYFDENGKNNGVITDITANLTTRAVNYYPGELYNYSGIKLFLSGVPVPTWARSYSVVRTDNLTYSKYLNWVSNRTLSGVGQVVDTKYAYIDISNIDQFNEQEQSTANVVSYGYEQGDRIRFTANFRPDGTTPQLYNDYPVVGFEIDPTIDGQVEVGRFVKIVYPTADITTIFDFNHLARFSNYGITLYHIASNTKTQNAGTDTNSGNVFFEFGYKFWIGNPGTNTAYHFGNVADNQVLLELGDVFFRPRTVPCCNTYYLFVNSAGFSNRYATLPTTSYPSATITETEYTVSYQAGLAADAENPAVYPTLGTPGGLLYVQSFASGFNVRLRGSIVVTPEHPTWVDIVCKIGNATTVLNPHILVHSNPIAANETATITFDQTVFVPPGYKLWLIFGNGEQITNLNCNGWLLRMDVIKNVDIICYDKSYSDIYNLVTNADNRPNLEDIEARRLQYNTMYRWGQQYQLNTDLNNSNRFYFQDSDEAVKSYGGIQFMSVIGKILHIFHATKCGTVGIFSKWIKNNDGTEQLIVNSTIIEKNNIRYAIYDGGVGNLASSIVVSNYAHYFCDPVNGNICRWSQDGVIILSLKYKTQTWSGTALKKYMDDYTYQFGGNARVFGTFQNVPDNNTFYFLMAQGGTGSNGDIDGRIVVFDETDNSFSGFWNGNADQIITLNNILYYFYNGKLYVQDDAGNYGLFFDTYYPLKLKLVWNEKVALKKKFLSFGYQANKYFIAPVNGDVKTNTISPDSGLQQISNFKAVDQDIEETERVGAFLFDANSMTNAVQAVNEGDYLGGNWIETYFQNLDDVFVFMYAPYILYELSPRNF